MSEKRDIILSEGSPVELVRLDGSVIPTIALIGRASRQSSTMETLEAHRRAHFIPELSVDSGETIHDLTTNDKFIVVAVYKEHFESEVIAVITHNVLCNTKLTLTTLTETVSSRGDIVKTEVVKFDGMDVFTQAATTQMKQQNPGIFVDTEYMVYAPAIDVSTLDKLTLTVGTRKTPLKVVHADYITFPGLVVIQACSETRM